MLLTEQRLARAVRAFVLTARIPRPDGWSMMLDELKIKRDIFPAMYAALGEIESVEPCHGFSLERASDLYCKGEE